MWKEFRNNKCRLFFFQSTLLTIPDWTNIKTTLIFLLFSIVNERSILKRNWVFFCFCDNILSNQFFNLINKLNVHSFVQRNVGFKIINYNYLENMENCFSYFEWTSEIESWLESFTRVLRGHPVLYVIDRTFSLRGGFKSTDPVLKISSLDWLFSLLCPSKARVCYPHKFSLSFSDFRFHFQLIFLTKNSFKSFCVTLTSVLYAKIISSLSYFINSTNPSKQLYVARFLI